MAVYQIGKAFFEFDGRRDGFHRKRSVAVYKCDCGKTFIRRCDTPKTSCGCDTKRRMSESRSRQKPTRTTHGKSKTKAYRVWDAMIQRCCNVSSTSYKNYGGRGITICRRWRESFEMFYQDMGDPPKGMTIDRVDNSKGYAPDNCEWATASQQARNRRRTIWITIGEVTMCASDWEKQPGAMRRHAIVRRYKSGMNPREAVFGKVQ